jgi:hypothetical protein
MTPFLSRLAIYISTPARRDFKPQGREDRFVWTPKQRIAKIRRHLPKKWVRDNAEGTAYAVNMHLMMRRNMPMGSR